MSNQLPLILNYRNSFTEFIILEFNVLLTFCELFYPYSPNTIFISEMKI